MKPTLAPQTIPGTVQSREPGAAQQLQLRELRRDLPRGEEWKPRGGKGESIRHCLQRGQQLLSGRLFLTRGDLIPLKVLGIPSF